MGGGGKGADTTNPMTGSLNKMAKEYWGVTDPLRNSIINQMGGFMGLTDPMTIQTGLGKNKQDTTFDWDYEKYGNTAFPSQYSPVINASRSGIENAYNQGRQNIIGNVPGGGARVEALTGLEGNRAGQYGQLYANTAQDMYNKAFGLSTGTAPQMAMGGMGTAGGLYNQGLGMENQSNMSKNAMISAGLSGLGMGAGSLIGGGKGGGGGKK